MNLLKHRALVLIIGLPLAALMAYLRVVARRNGKEPGGPFSIREALSHAWKSPESWEAYRNRPPEVPLHPENLATLVRFHSEQEAEQARLGNHRKAAKHAERRAQLVAAHGHNRAAISSSRSR